MRIETRGRELAAAGLVILLGVVAVPALPDEEEAASDHTPKTQYRAWACVVGGLIAFIILGRYGGLLPATFVLVFVSALGDDGNSVKSALLLAVGVCVMAAVLFSWLLQMQFPLLSWG